MDIQTGMQTDKQTGRPKKEEGWAKEGESRIIFIERVEMSA